MPSQWLEMLVVSWDWMGGTTEFPAGNKPSAEHLHTMLEAAAGLIGWNE